MEFVPEVEPDSTSTKTDISKDLEEQLVSLKALATTHNLLQEGRFPLSHMKAIASSVAFIASLHKSLLDEAVKHEDAAKADELKPHFKALKNENS